MLLVALKLQLRVVKSMDLGSGIMKGIMKYTTVKISEIRKHPTLRLDPKYWIKRKKDLTMVLGDDRMNLERNKTYE